MRILKLVFVALIIFFSLDIGALSCEITHTSVEVFSSVSDLQNNFIEEKNQPPISISNQRSNCSFNFSRKENNDLSNNDNFVGIIPNKEQNKLIRYIKKQTYLENGNELALLPLLHQIQPNAP